MARNSPTQESIWYTELDTWPEIWASYRPVWDKLKEALGSDTWARDHAANFAHAAHIFRTFMAEDVQAMRKAGIEVSQDGYHFSAAGKQYRAMGRPAYARKALIAQGMEWQQARKAVQAALCLAWLKRRADGLRTWIAAEKKNSSEEN